MHASVCMKVHTDTHIYILSHLYNGNPSNYANLTESLKVWKVRIHLLYWRSDPKECACLVLGNKYQLICFRLC